jgi:AsmA protein
MLLVLFIVINIMGLTIWIITKRVAPSAIKDLINKELSTITTQKSHIDGDVAWHLFPHPGIKITQIRVADEINQADCSLYIEKLLLNLKLNSLLRGKLVFKEIKIDGLTLNIKNPELQSSVMLGKITDRHSINNDSSPVQFAIDRFSLTRGQMVMTQTQDKITLSDIQLSAKQLNLKNMYFPLQIKTGVAISTPGNKIKGTLTYDGGLRIPASILTSPYKAFLHSGIKGQLLINKVQLNQVKISKISTSAVTKKGLIVLNPFNAALYTGKSVGNLSYQLSTKKLSINQTATGLNANQFFKLFFGKSLVKGSLDIAIHGFVNLQDPNFLRNFIGDGSLSIKDGILYFIDLQTLADSASKKIHSLPTQDQNDLELALEQPLVNAKVNPPGTTKFQLLGLTYRVLNNKFMNDSLLLQTNNIELKGNGQIDLNNGALTGNLSAKLLTADNMVDTIQRLLGGSFPLILSGTITEPNVIPNDREINPIMTRYILKNALVYPVKQIKNQIKNLINTPEYLLSD